MSSFRETLVANPRQRRKRSRRWRRLAPLLLVDAGVNGNVGHVAGIDELRSYQRRLATRSLTPREAGVMAQSTPAPPVRPQRASARNRFRRSLSRESGRDAPPPLLARSREDAPGPAVTRFGFMTGILGPTRFSPSLKLWLLPGIRKAVVAEAPLPVSFPLSLRLKGDSDDTWWKLGWPTPRRGHRQVRCSRGSSPRAGAARIRLVIRDRRWPAEA